jgi:hypothetical protein
MTKIKFKKTHACCSHEIEYIATPIPLRIKDYKAKRFSIVAKVLSSFLTQSMRTMKTNNEKTNLNLI